MKGHFSLQKEMHNEVAYIFFGNLRGDDLDSTAIAIDEEQSHTAKLIAHDVFDHSVRHRTNRYITWEEELRALGGAVFRGVDVDSDLHSILPYLARDLTLPMIAYPAIVDIDKDTIDAIAECELHISTYEAIMANLNYGYALKKLQFTNNPNKAYQAYDFIAYNVEGFSDRLLNDDYNKYSFYFDTEMKIFRHSVYYKH